MQDTRHPAVLATVRRQALFADLSEGDLDELLTMASVREVEAGEVLLEEGSDGDDMFIILSGEIEIYRDHGKARRVLVVRGEGEVVGEMAPLGGTRRTASAQALTETRLLVIGHEALQTLLSCSATAALTMVRTVTGRLRGAEAMLVQQEKLAGLGTMAAGLAHELNNPAAAIARSTGQLDGTLDTWTAAMMALASEAWTPAERASVERLLTEARTIPGDGTPPSALEAMDLESDVAAVLEEFGVPDGWESAATLVAAGWTPERVRTRLLPFAGPRAPAVVRCLAAASEVGQLLTESRTGSEAIAAIVRSVKSYSYLDQAPQQEIDVHEGLGSTLVMLRHKLKEGIDVERQFASDLPRIQAYGSELNQVWTNLIDNAADAMDGRGTLRLRTALDDGRVVVEICDDGPGIPPEIQSRVFDPFFTTKAVGSGTGLGLHVAYSIVKRHHGEIRLESVPGQTCFRIELPTDG